ncbi:Zn(2)-C6 fungal-type domain-containing protein [Mycena venus]|uniref:Zn(2)-C6 fungal-type domain-containing protein n=1 Tax=Mycena venus TaxID=2733690 RepID=A0A8H6XKV7_9AGAR|nr:Zn(2)-C6 fungal-type domain-containing protein [Mycena venus]
MSQSLFDIPKRVAVACSNCRDRKVKCIHESSQRSCMRCRFNGLPCQYIATRKQRARSRNAGIKSASSRNCTRNPKRTSPLPPPSPVGAPGSPTSEGSVESSLDGSLGGFSPSGLGFLDLDFSLPPPATAEYIFPTTSHHIHPWTGHDYRPVGPPPSPYLAPIRISRHGSGVASPMVPIQNDLQSEMYLSSAPAVSLDCNFEIPTVYPINHAEYGWNESIHASQCYCVCTAVDPLYF